MYSRNTLMACIVVLTLAVTFAAPQPVAAQCGECAGAFLVFHFFPDGEDPESTDRECIIPNVPEPVGCHTNWYYPGCEVHPLCGFQEDEQALVAEALLSEDATAVRTILLSLNRRFGFEAQTRSLTAYCGDVIVMRFGIPENVDASIFASSLGLRQ